MSIQPENIIKRAGILTGVLLLFLAIIAVRIVVIQVKDGKKYQDMSVSITEKIDTIYANKGNVYAADGSLLATSMFRYEVRMDVVTVDAEILRDSVVPLSKKLARFLGETPEYYQKRIRQAISEKNRYLFIAKNLNYPEYQTIKSFPIFNLGANKGGFITIQNTVREHPLGKVAQRTIGYDDYRGMPGIEGAYAAELRGKNGLRLKQKIAKGQWKPINDANEIEPQDGKDIITTIDVNMQDIAHNALLEQLVKHQAEHGTAVLMEVKTGEIKAIVNLGRAADGSYYESRNYAVYESHEPGSTFKIASMLVALEDKVIDTSTVVDTEGGSWELYGKHITDSNHKGYGKISAARSLEVSSNVGISKLIYDHYKDNPKKFVDGLKRLGLDQKLGVPIKGEGAPIIPTPGTKSWNGTSLAWMSFGYGVQLTPLQTLTFYNAIANDGIMVRPKFVKEVSYQNNKKGAIVYPTEIINPKIASQETLSKLKAIMMNTVKRGTAAIIYTPNYSLAGKTGTCQANYWTNDMYYISSFAGFFPYENPRYSCIVIVHRPIDGYYGSTVAAPVFQKIAHKIYAATPTVNKVKKGTYAYKALDQNYEAYTFKQTKSAIMPNVTGMPGMDAISLLENMDLRVQIQGIGSVVSQSVLAGSSIQKGNTIYLTLY